MNTIEEVRRINLLWLIAQAGSQTALAEKVGKDPNQFSQYINEHKNLGRAFCRDLETALKFEEGWMDTDHNHPPEQLVQPRRRKSKSPSRNSHKNLQLTGTGDQFLSLDRLTLAIAWVRKQRVLTGGQWDRKSPEDLAELLFLAADVEDPTESSQAIRPAIARIAELIGE